MKISYAITVCNELKEIQQLVGFLLTHKQNEDEIVILMDSNGTEEVWSYLLKIESELGVLNTIPFNKDFSKFKNHLNSLCSGDYIFNIDADETPSETLIDNIHKLIEMNPEVKAFALPRVNTVEGLTQEHIQKWGWRVDDENRVNYPDYQVRIYKNIPEIYWEGKVHETLNIKKEVVSLPYGTEDWALYHPKQIERQEKQNNYYNTL
jgi:glycosyltransferase involved in cell wall biosynthesis